MAKALIIIAALFLGVLSRWFPHPPNFTPVIAIAIFMGMRLNNRWLVALTPLAIMIISDLLLGFHLTSIITYSALVILALGVQALPKNGVWNSKPLKVVGYSLGGSLWFFLTSNAAVWWFMGMYTKNFAGLMQSYVAGIPFFHNTLISTLVFTTTLVLLDKLIQRRVSTSLAKI